MHARMDGWMDGGRTGWLGWLAVWVGGWVDADGRWLGGWVGGDKWLDGCVCISYHITVNRTCKENCIKSVQRPAETAETSKTLQSYIHKPENTPNTEKASTEPQKTSIWRLERSR